MYQVRHHSYGDRHLVFIAEEVCSWLPESNPVVESYCVSRGQVKTTMRDLQATADQMNRGGES